MCVLPCAMAFNMKRVQVVLRDIPALVASRHLPDRLSDHLTYSCYSSVIIRMSDSAECEALQQRERLRGKRKGSGDNTGGQTAEKHKAAELAGEARCTDTQQPAQQLENLTHHDQRLILPEMPAYRSAAVGEHKFEWGTTLQEAFEEVGLAMFNYMTPIDDLLIDEACTRDISVTGHDLQSLLFAYLDELLFVYCTEYIIMKHIHISHMDTHEFTITATGRGEKFNRDRHECGTEVKAITYSAMQITETEQDAEVFVIVDI